MADIEMYEGSGFNIYLTLTYGANFDGGVEGDPIPRSALTRIWFYLKRKKDDTLLITKSDRDDSLANTPSEIQWTNEAGGLATVKLLDTDADGMAAKDCTFEVWGKLASNSQMVLLDRGTADILDSIRT